MLCEIPSDPADLNLENLAKGERDTIKQHNNEPIGKIQYNNPATVRAYISKTTHRRNISTNSDQPNQVKTAQKQYETRHAMN